MGFFSKKNKEPVQDEESYDYDREYEVEENHSLPLDTANITQAKKTLLFRLNLAAAIFQTLSAVGIFLLIVFGKENDGITFYTNYPKPLEEDVEGRPDVGPDAQPQFTINIGWLSGTFLALSALDHLLVCSVCKGPYERGLSRNFNVFRWVEYAFSASIMRVIVGSLSGMIDLHMQFLNFGLAAVTMLFGLIFELENKKKRLTAPGEIRWYLYWIGFIPHIFSWTVVIGFFFYSLSTNKPPTFVYAIIGIIFTLDLTFAIVLGLQWRAKGCFRPYVNGEIAFIILSFTSKNLLAWINFFGGNA